MECPVDPKILDKMLDIEPSLLITEHSETTVDQVASLLLWIALGVGALVFFPVILLVLWNKRAIVFCLFVSINFKFTMIHFHNQNNACCFPN